MKFSYLLYRATSLSTASAFSCTPSAFNAILGSNASVVSASLLPENSTFHVPPSDIAFPQSPAGLHALCALEVKVADSDAPYSFGLFLPKSWNGRFL
jgi:feruloyl esterase